MNVSRTACGILLACVCVSAAVAEDEPKQWAILIGVQEHDTPQLDLNFTTNDAAEIKTTLVNRAGIPEERILVLTDDSGTPPTKAALLSEVTAFLKKPQSGDQILIYYSGHGHLHEGETYLVPKDYDPRRHEETGLKVSLLRGALIDCPAKVKFLVLDCCHAGGAKSGDEPDISAEELAKGFMAEPISGCMVLASCAAQEKSYEWPQRKQGIFSFWLCRGLDGGADEDGDGNVSFDEVYSYTRDRVEETADRIFSKSQTPRRQIDAEVDDVWTVLQLRPEPPESVCRRLAAHLDLEIRHRKLRRVGVLEFLRPLGRSYGLGKENLPKWFTDRMQSELTTLAGSTYKVIDGSVMAAASKDADIEIIEDPDSLEDVARSAGGLDGVITGQLRRRGTKMHVTCELVKVDGGASLLNASGVFPLSVDLVGELGESIDNRDRPVVSPYNEQSVAQMLESQDHPQLRTDEDAFPFKLEVWTVSTRSDGPVTDNHDRRDLRFEQKNFVVLSEKRRGDDEPKRSELLIAAREGEIFEVRVVNRCGAKVAMTLLVDGINVLGQQRQRLGHAWSWVLDSAEKSEPRTHVFEGWYLPNEKRADPSDRRQFTVKRFKFVDLADSVAGRRKFGDSIGLITAAFYWEKGAARSPLGVGEGPEEQRQLRTVNFTPGRCMGILQIRYVNKEDLDRMLRGEEN